MRYYRRTDGAGSRLVAVDGDATYDLTAARLRLTSFRDLVRAADVVGERIDAVADRVTPEADRVDPPTGSLAPPVAAGEVWAAGVTYRVSAEARQAESGMAEVYARVYEGERPELFLKATPSRTVGPGDDVGVRGDSEWDVPEPELGVVLHDGDVVGYTVGNDVSSRSIEGENPLYLPQAKVYDRCCAVGPCVASAESVGDPHDLDISMTITRDGETAFEGETSTSLMKKSCEELVAHYTRSNPVPELSVLPTGTSIVPDDDFTLTEGDEVEIDIDGIGRLRNGVTTV